MKSAVFFISGLEPDCARSNWAFKFPKLRIKQVLNYNGVCFLYCGCALQKPKTTETARSL